MKKFSFALIFLLSQFACQNRPVSDESSKTINPSAQIFSIKTNSDISNKTTDNEAQKVEKMYPGVTIDQKFPIIEGHDFREADFKERTYSVKAENFEVSVKKFAPLTISKDGKTIFDFTTRYPNEYHSNLVGISNLLGKNSKELYVVALGPGGVCCTNYWITDVLGRAPRNIFRSEDFGSFRDPMEIFDADGDGIYELMQWDSAFRYFMGDCGTCSPEPRAVFKYDKRTRTYIPATGIQQDFVKENFLQTQKWIVESFEQLSKEQIPELEVEYNRRFLDHIVDLFYLGEEKKAWKTFDKYYIGYSGKEEVRAEIKKRLQNSKFYQALKKSS